MARESIPQYPVHTKNWSFEKSTIMLNIHLTKVSKMSPVRRRRFSTIQKLPPSKQTCTLLASLRSIKLYLLFQANFRTYVGAHVVKEMRGIFEDFLSFSSLLLSPHQITQIMKKNSNSATELLGAQASQNTSRTALES